ncbi:hypothetical protein [Thiothrix lacustris]|uniref:hypothetical protein n=1 Tax=Thiothrix lacustris TaxID=525917 RepID=UPI0027E4FC0A|nr:hypothetical protein [Thiothrix lacustris]WMP19042.1 hypothetical protein RCS87_08250 [Thiothrix lacustris]
MKHITRLRVHIADTTVGELGTDARGRIYFQYDPAGAHGREGAGTLGNGQQGVTLPQLLSP